jgi:MFS family permease
VTRLASNPRLPLSGLLGASAISLIGSMLSLIALPWFVLQTTGSPAKAGLVGFAAFLPAFLAGLFGGVLVDRTGFKRVSVAADFISGIGIAAIPLLYHTVGLEFWQLLALVFFGALLEVPGLTARRSLLPELAERANVRLERANAAFESIDSLALLVGPPLAGLLISSMGASNVLWLDASSFFVSALTIGILVPRDAHPSSISSDESYWHGLLAGLRFIRRDRLLFPMAIVLAIFNGLSGSLFAVVLPVYVKDAFGTATNFGLLVAASGAGALGGAMLYGSLGYRIPRAIVWLGGYMLAPLEYWALSLSPPFAVLLLALLIAGIAIGPLNPLMVTVRHERSPIVLRGRVFSTYSAIALAVQPFGIVVCGYLVEEIGLHSTVVLTALLLQALAVGMLFIPAFREIDDLASPQDQTRSFARQAQLGHGSPPTS